ncbi:MAG: trypsin-like serine protease [Myxococcota bacterium]
MLKPYWISLSLLLCASCVSQEQEIDVSTSAIVDGERTSNNEPAIVAVLNRFGGLCTGTLIAPRVVLTAKHCVQNPGASAPSAASAFVIGIGDNINRLTQTFRATEIVTTPGVYTDRGGLGGALVGIDVAVITLSTPASITPIPVHRESGARVVGQAMRAVGFGQIPSGGAGVKYRTGTTVSGVMGGVIFTPPTICQGDSGGPLLTVDPEEVIGVASFGSGGCGSGINGYNRVDLFLDMIDEAVRESGVCVGDGTEICDGEDNDCDDAFDEGCTEIGGSCGADDECVGTTCRNPVGTGSICTQACDPQRPQTGCPPGLYCASAGGCEGFCAPGEAGALPNDADCTADTDCASLFCLDPGDGRQRCLNPCRGDAGMCLDGEACAAPAGSCSGCVDASIIAGSRGLGEPCESGDDCGSGTCIDDAGAMYCSRGCERDLDCVDEFHCRVEDEVGLCVRGDRGGVGAACVRNDDCDPALFCASRDGVSWCSAFCEDAAADCPPDFSCVDAGGASVCAPDRGVSGSPCDSSDDCISGSCQPVGSGGSLLCTRLCGPDSLCEAGFECVRTADGVNAVCVPAGSGASGGGGGGGCSAAGAGNAPWMALLLALVALPSVRRRRRRGGETSGGETSGGETSGGETSGGETSGGETKGME